MESSSYAVAVQGGLSQGEGGSPHQRRLGKHGASLAIMGLSDHVLHSAVAALHRHSIPAMGIEETKQDDALRASVESIFEHYGRFDILVDAAAGKFLAAADHLSLNGFRTVIDIDAVGAFMMCRKALKYLQKGGPGKEPSCDGIIINVSATLHYTVTWSLALEWGTNYGIRVNGIAPGSINDTTGASKLGPDEVMKEMQQMPLFKLRDKWDIAMAAVYLASDAGKLIIGITLVIFSGQ